MELYESIKNALVACDNEAQNKLVIEALENDIPARDILNRGLISGMDIVGERMQKGEMFIPEVLMAAQCMASAVELLKPLLGDEDQKGAGRIIIGTVKGDLHDIGKNLVIMMMKSAGFDVIDLGVDVSSEIFVKAIEENDTDILALSALLTTTMPMMEKTIQAVNESRFRQKLKIIVGGAPVTREFAEKVGADGYAPDAGSASKLAKQLCLQGG
jgi:5-methyltetrahydrofolate--homocysteine methyltransferase